MATLPLPTKYYVYAAFDGEEIVYVGLTVNTQDRWASHKSVSKWCTSQIVFKVLSEHFIGGLTAELKAIQQFEPKFNVGGTVRDSRRG